VFRPVFPCDVALGTSAPAPSAIDHALRTLTDLGSEVADVFGDTCGRMVYGLRCNASESSEDELRGRMHWFFPRHHFGP